MVNLYDAIQGYPELTVDTRHGQVSLRVLTDELKVSDKPWSFVVNRVRVELDMALELNGDGWRPINWTARKRDADWRHNLLSRSADDKVRYDVPEDINAWIAENPEEFKDAQAAAERVRVHNRCIYIRIDLERHEHERDELNDKILALRMEYMKLSGKRDPEEPLYAAQHRG